MLWRRDSARNVSYCLPHGDYYPHQHSVDTPVLLLAQLESNCSTVWCGHSAKQVKLAFTGDLAPTVVCHDMWRTLLLPFLFRLARYKANMEIAQEDAESMMEQCARCVHTVHIQPHNYPPTSPPACPPTYQPTHDGTMRQVRAYYPYLPTYLTTQLPTYSTTYPPTFLLACPPTYQLPTHLPTYPPTYPHTAHPGQN